MELFYLDHVRERLIRREMTEEMIDNVLMNPQWMPSIGPSTCYDCIVGGRRLRVVVAEEHHIPYLITAHWVSEEQ